VVWQGR